MLELWLRPTFQKLFVDPLAKNCLKLNVTKNPLMLTLISGILGLLVPVFLWLHLPVFAILFLLLSGLTDMLDGTIARIQNLQSHFGCVVDIMMDRLVEILVIFGLYIYIGGNNTWIFMGMLAANLLCITSFLGVGIFSQNESHKSFYYSPGIMERAEAFIFYIFMIVLPSYIVPLAALYCILVLYTAIKRLKEFRQSCNQLD